MLFNRIVIDSHDVWSSLEECDIFGAAKIIVQAKIFLETHNTSLVMRNDNALAFPLPFCRFFSASAFSEVGLSSESGAIKNLSMALAGCSSAIFLSQVSGSPSIWSFTPFAFACRLIIQMNFERLLFKVEDKQYEDIFHRFLVRAFFLKATTSIFFSFLSHIL